MAKGNFTLALDRVLAHEGGAVNNPKDPGGRTNFGVTQAVYDVYRIGKGLAPADVYKIGTNERDEIYRKQYWDAVCGEALPPGLDYVLFDGAVNSGVMQSVKWLQRALGNVKIDGQIGSLTLTAVGQSPDLLALIVTSCEARREFLRHLQTFSIFGKGWSRRVNDVQGAALAWASGATLPPAAAGSHQAKASREDAIKSPTTIPGDMIVAASGVGLATTALASKSDAVTAAPTSENPTTALPSANSQDSGPTSGAAPSTSITPNPDASVQPGAAASSAPATIPAGPTPPDASAASHPPSTAPATTTATPDVQNSSNTTAPSTSTATTAGAPDAASPASTAPNANGSNDAASTPPATSTATATPSSSAVNPAPTTPVTQTKSVAPADTSSLAGSKMGMDLKALAQKAFSQQEYLGFVNSDNQQPVTIVALSALLVASLFMSSSSRQVRARRADALGDNSSTKTILKPSTTTKKIPASTWQTPDLSGAAATWTDLAKRVFCVAWIAATIGINVIALAKLLQGFGLEYVDWHGPFVWLGRLYDAHASQAFSATSNVVTQNYGITLPVWLSSLQQFLVPVFVLYVSTASAFAIGSKGLLPKGTSAEDLMGEISFKSWLFMIPTFVLDAIRYRIVTRFAQQHTFLFLLYVLAAVGGYFGAVYINGHIDLPSVEQVDQATAIVAHEYEYARTLISGSKP